MSGPAGTAPRTPDPIGVGMALRMVGEEGEEEVIAAVAGAPQVVTRVSGEKLAEIKAALAARRGAAPTW